MTKIARPRAATPAPDALDEPVENPRAVLGNNRPPVDVMAREDFAAAIDKHQGLRQRITDLLGSASRASATDTDSAGRCAELIRQINAVEKTVDIERTAVKAPYLAAGRSIDDAAKTLVAELGEAKVSVRTMAETFMREEQRKADAIRREREAEARRQREEQEARQRAEEARAAAENREAEVIEPVAPVVVPKAPEPVQVRSDFGAVASARRVKVATITDWTKAFRSVKNVAAVQEAIQKAVNGLVRAGQTDIPGVTISDDIGLSVR